LSAASASQEKNKKSAWNRRWITRLRTIG
jgi:hypothetical protein